MQRTRLEIIAAVREVERHAYLSIPDRVSVAMSTTTRVTDAVLVIVDISGYTRFVQQRPVSLEHAEAIVTELMEAIIDCVGSPMVVNKLEGDAALLYVETRGRGRRAAALSEVFAQLARFFAIFSRCLQAIGAARSHCHCDACANIEALRLKAFLHVGEIVIKQVRQFEEIAGEAVIRVHRMTKNSLPLHEYVLMTQDVVAAAGQAAPPVAPQAQSIDGEAVILHWCEVSALPPVDEDVASRPASALTRARQRLPVFHHLPPVEVHAKPRTWWARLVGERFRR